MKLRLDKIQLPDALMRKVVDEVGLENLARSIRRLGVIIPLIVRKNGKIYELVAGMRRLMAAEMCGLEEVPVIVRDSDDGEAEAVKMAENREREDVNAIDEGEYMAAVMERNGWTQKELAKELGVSEGLVSQRLKTAVWLDETKKAVRRGELRFTVAREIEQVKNDIEKKRLMKVAIDSGVTPQVAAQWRREINTALETEQLEVAIERSQKITHQPQKVYVPCQTCEDPMVIETTIFLRICQSCYDVIKKAL